MLPSFLYYIIYYNALLILTLWYVISSKAESAKDVLRGNKSLAPSFLLCIILIIFIGGRPITYSFGDTPMYAHLYNVTTETDTSSESLFFWIILTCKPFMDASGFFTVVAAGYFGFMLWGCIKLMPNNIWVALLITLASYSFFSYGTNGIRNGLACSLVILGLSFMAKDKKQQIIGLAICFTATFIHRSTALPFLMSIVALYAIRNFKIAYSFWIASIVISLILGNSVANLFAAMGFDDRLSGYMNNTDNLDQFSHTGFRWDFLLYSAMPIVLGYYIIIKRGIRNRTYEFLLNTYILSNAFWVMVIRAAFSNRFAYLSWFLYPIVIAYPLLRLPIWKTNQGKRLNQIMMANIGFTYIMWLLGK